MKEVYEHPLTVLPKPSERSLVAVTLKKTRNRQCKEYQVQGRARERGKEEKKEDKRRGYEDSEGAPGGKRR